MNHFTCKAFRNPAFCCPESGHLCLNNIRARPELRLQGSTLLSALRTRRQVASVIDQMVFDLSFRTFPRPEQEAGLKAGGVRRRYTS